MEFFGWIVFMLLGSCISFYGVFATVFILTDEGLEAAVPAFFCGIIAAVAWLIFAVWLSPFSSELFPVSWQELMKEEG